MSYAVSFTYCIMGDIRSRNFQNSEVLPCVIVRPIKDSVNFIEKFNKDLKELTLLDLL